MLLEHTTPIDNLLGVRRAEGGGIPGGVTGLGNNGNGRFVEEDMVRSNDVTKIGVCDLKILNHRIVFCSGVHDALSIVRLRCLCLLPLFEMAQ
jgi:hypothetical protein